MRQKGVLILTEARSGSNWLGTLLENTGRLGHPWEWFTAAFADKAVRRSAGAWTDHALKGGSTPNGVFAIKLFPPHVHAFHDRYGVDLLRWFLDHHDVRLLHLTRRDRLRHAISLVRGLQTRKWTVQNTAVGTESYDFDAICRAVLWIERSDAFWRSCRTLYGVDLAEFVYEDMMDSPMPFVEAVAEHAGVEIGAAGESSLTIQRDAITEDWCRRFEADRRSAAPLDFASPIPPPRRTLANLARLAAGRDLLPPHYRFKLVRKKRTTAT